MSYTDTESKSVIAHKVIGPVGVALLLILLSMILFM